MRRTLVTLVLRSTGRVTLTLTRGADNSMGGFIRLVGRETTRLNYGGARFGGPGNLPSRARCAATNSVVGVTGTT